MQSQAGGVLVYVMMSGLMHIFPIETLNDKHFSFLQEKLLIGEKETKSTVQLTYDAFSLVSF